MRRIRRASGPSGLSHAPQGRTGRAFRAFPGRPWRRTQDSVGHKTDDKRDRKKERNEWEKGKMCKEKNN